jgi:hypothetical protein
MQKYHLQKYYKDPWRDQTVPCRIYVRSKILLQCIIEASPWLFNLNMVQDSTRTAVVVTGRTYRVSMCAYLWFRVQHSHTSWCQRLQAAAHIRHLQTHVMNAACAC